MSLIARALERAQAGCMVTGGQGRAQDFSQVWAEFFRNKKQKSGT